MARVVLRRVGVHAHGVESPADLLCVPRARVGAGARRPVLQEVGGLVTAEALVDRPIDGSQAERKKRKQNDNLMLLVAVFHFDHVFFTWMKPGKGTVLFISSGLFRLLNKTFSTNVVVG